MAIAMERTTQNRVEDALARLFGSSARVTVLRVFVLDPHREYYQRQLEAATGLPIRAVQRELIRLEKAGLLYRRTEGNRAYYRMDTGSPLFQELRALVLKAMPSLDRLRALLIADRGVHLAFLSETGESVLVVAADGASAALEAPPAYALESMSLDEFKDAVSLHEARLETYLTRGCDLLGRRDDLVWRYIEAAGYSVRKGEGVA